MKKAWFLKGVTAGLALAATVGARAGEPFQHPDPRDLVIYQIFIDRFNNGDPSNDEGNPRAVTNPAGPTSFHGGDIAGIRQKLPYIKALGANGIWITPFVENVDNYHGYAAFNWYNVDPNFGTLAELAAMIEEANALGIAVYFDMVAGHCGDIINSRDAGYPGYLPPPGVYNLRWRRAYTYPAPFNSLESFHAHGQIGNYSAPEQELGELAGLDDLKTETPFVREEMTKIWTYWMQNTNVSGFRIDTIKHVDVGMWEYLLPRLRDVAVASGNSNFFTFGEIYGADYNYMQDYVGTFRGSAYKLDSALDFQYYYAADGIFARNSRAPSDLNNLMTARQSQLGAHHLWTPNFFDNHDVPRFLSSALSDPGSGLAERLRRLELALVSLFTAPGPPVVYYGTEQAFDGGGDPYNREDMWDGQFESGPSLGDNFNTGTATFRTTARLAKLRRDLVALRRGSFTGVAASSGGPGLLAYTRTSGTESVLVAINTALTTVNLPQQTIANFANRSLVNALDPTESVTVGADGRFPARALGAQDAEIWIPEEQLPVQDPEVAGFTPANGEVGVATGRAALEVRFLVPMNPTTTAAAVSLTPNIPWTPSWDAEGRVLTMVLGGGLQERASYTVSVATTATSAAGAPLVVPASATWTVQRAVPTLPPLPAPYGPLARVTGPIVLDGSEADWPSVALAPDTGAITPGSTFLWNDAADDDFGPDAYTYPTDVVFNTAEADLRRVQVAYDATQVYFLIVPGGIEPGATFFTPYFTIAVDVEDGAGKTTSLGFDQNLGQGGLLEVLPRPDAAPDFELTLTGPRGATLTDAAGNVVDAPAMAFSQATGVVEVAVPRAQLGLDSTLAGRVIGLYVASALETYGAPREVGAAQGQWDPGGGITAASDPDVFDLVGADEEGQRADLGDYDALYPSYVLRSLLRVNLSEITTTPSPTVTPSPTPVPTPRVREGWMYY